MNSVTTQTPPHPRGGRSSLPLHVDIHWNAEALQGAALAAADTLRALNVLAEMRGRRLPAVTWRWLAGPGRRAPASLPRGPAPAARPLPDLLLIPGWHARNGPHLDAHLGHSAWLARHAARTHAAGGGVLALHTGVVLLADAGLLEGREAVAPWPFLPTLLRHTQGAGLRGDTAWTAHDRVWTASSPALATELLLDAVSHHSTPGSQGLTELAQAIGQVLLHAPDRQLAGAQFTAIASTRRVPPGAVERARRHLEDKLDQPYDLKALAAAAATSPSTLLRHFEVSQGKTPLAHLQALRVARAQVLLETTYLPVEQVAQACGYPNLGTFRRVFSRATGEMPGAYRERHRLRVRRREWGGDLDRKT